MHRISQDYSEPFDLKHAEVTDQILHVFYDVYNELGDGFLESVYHQAMCIALSDNGLNVEREVPIPVLFRGHVLGEYRADLVVGNTVIVELKTAKVLDPAHAAQVVHYLRATDKEVGLLLNFGPQPTFKRFFVANTRKKIRLNPSESVVKSL